MSDFNWEEFEKADAATGRFGCWFYSIFAIVIVVVFILSLTN